MNSKNQSLFCRLDLITDGVLIFASMLLAYYYRFDVMKNGVENLAVEAYYYAAFGIAVFQMIAGSWIGIYRLRNKRRFRRICLDIVLVNVIGILILQAVLFLLKLSNFSRLVVLFFFLTETVAVLGKHTAVWYLIRTLRRRGRLQRTVILVGSNDTAMLCCREMTANPTLGYRVLGYVSDTESEESLNYLGRPEEILQILEELRPDEVLAAMEAGEETDVIMLTHACDAMGAQLSLVMPYISRRTASLQIDTLNDVPLLVMRNVPLDYFGNAALKRTGDLIGSSLLILLLSPLLLVIALGVKLSSKGPVFFCQERIGFHGNPFVMYKFRSMRENEEEDTAWTQKEDPRRTVFGAFLRRWSLDELPQLFNVLKGDMSLVGPRPEIPVFVEQFRQNIPLYMVKHMVRPGMTGLAQVNGLRGDTSIARRIELDVYYVENWTVWMDFQILLRTFKYVKNEEETLISTHQNTRKER